MLIKSVLIEGLRGYAKPEVLDLAHPSGAPGSGLTVLVGPNNAGKSTLIEAFSALNAGPPSITEGKRNKVAGDRVRIEIEYADGERAGIVTGPAGGSETRWAPAQVREPLMILPSRRKFSPMFGRHGNTERRSYAQQVQLPATRGTKLDSFVGRLFKIQDDPTEFNKVLRDVVNPVPIWNIDQNDGGNYYLKFRAGEHAHNSDGMGDGLVSILFLVDALYDSKPADVIIIDEPELSLHPALQRRLARLFVKYSADRQIVVATHSPYFVSWEALAAGGELARVFKRENRCIIAPLAERTTTDLLRFTGNLNFPHTLGLDARECFFLDDGVVLVEGQEDVVIYERLARDLGVVVNGDFFGWGVGGADNMKTFAQMLTELGFERVVGILDGNKEAQAIALGRDFPRYTFLTIPTPDVRTKPAREAQSGVEGLADHGGTVRPEHREAALALLKHVNKALGEPKTPI